jgi:molecular chaperone HscB
MRARQGCRTRWTSWTRRCAASARARLAQVGKLLDAGDYQQAAQGVRALMFLDKFGDELHYAFEALES